MKNYFCNICGIGFKTLNAKKHHEGIPIRKIYDHSFVLSTNKKYFLFTDARKITRKHNKLYGISYFYKYFVDSNVLKESKIKKSNFKFPSSLIEKKIKIKIIS